MGFYGYRGGFGRFGYVGDPIVGDIGFDEQWSRDDWQKQWWGNNFNGAYMPLAGTIIDKARAVWTQLKDLVDNQTMSAPKAQARMDQLRNDMAPHIAIVDNITRSHNYGYVTNPGTVMRTAGYTTINALLLAFSNEKWPTVDEDEAAKQAADDAAAAAQAAEAARQKAAHDAEVARQAKAAADAADAAAKLKQTQDAIQAAKDAIAAADKAKAVAQASAVVHKQAQAVAVQKAATAAGRTPYLIGALVLATAAAVFLARRSGSKKVAGYRRRRR